MSFVLPLAGLALANMLGIISPGPAFLMVSRAAAAGSLRTALGLAAGVGIAATTWATLACFGVALLMTRFAALYGLIQLLGGVFLIWLGISAWRQSRKGETRLAAEAGASNAGALPGNDRHAVLRAVAVGAMLNIGNPKIVIFFSSIFAALLPADAPLWVPLTVIAIVAVQEVTWYSMVAFVFSRPKVQTAYGRARTWIERAFGTVLIGIGARILATVRFA